MGEHKLHEAGNGDGDKKPISSHLVETIDFPSTQSGLAEKIEQAYTSLAERAKAEDSLIVAVAQAVSAYAAPGQIGGRVVVILTAQRIGREDFERQQRMAQFGAGGPRR